MADAIDRIGSHLTGLTRGLGVVEIIAPNGIGEQDDGVRAVIMSTTDEMRLSESVEEGGISLGDGLRIVFDRLRNAGAAITSLSSGVFILGEDGILKQVKLMDALESRQDAFLLGPVCLFVDISGCLSGLPSVLALPEPSTEVLTTAPRAAAQVRRPSQFDRELSLISYNSLNYLCICIA